MRIATTLSCLAVFGVPLLAQTPPARLAPAQQPASAPQQVPAEQKLRHICRQLDLSDQQWQHVEALLELFRAEAHMKGDELAERMEEIQSLWQARREAEQAGDAERVQALNEQIRNLAPPTSAERKFVDGLLPTLNDEQKTRFNTLYKRFEGATDLWIKPIEVVRLARNQKLTPDQERQLEQRLQAFREAIATAKDPDRRDLLIGLVNDVWSLLTPAQRSEFDKEVNFLDPELPPRGTAPKAPVTQPAQRP